MTAIAAPASVLPSAPALASGYDKDAAEGFGALLAQAGSAGASDDKAATRDVRDAGKALDKAADRAQDKKTSDIKAGDRAADAKADKVADAADKAADPKTTVKLANGQATDKASDAQPAQGKTDDKTDSKDQAAVVADGQVADATVGQADAAALAAAVLIAAMQAPAVQTPKPATDAAAAAQTVQAVATETASAAVAQDGQAPALALPAEALATDAAETAPALTAPPTASAAELAAAVAAAKSKTSSTAPTAKADVAATAPAATPAVPAAEAAAATIAAPAADPAEPAPVQVAPAQAAAPEVASITGKVVKAAEPKTTASTTASAVAAAVADAVAEPGHGPVAAAAHAATTGEGAMGDGAQDHANAQGSPLKDAAPVTAAADAPATAPAFVAPGTAAAPAPIVAAQLPPKAGPETVNHLTTEIASKAVVGKTSRFDVVLQPEGLGRVDVRIEIAKDGKLTAALNFDNPAAAADLRGKSGELRQALAAAGFNVADNALSFDSSSQNQGGQSQNAFFNFQDGENGRQAFQGRAFRSALGEEIPTLSPSALLPGLRVADSSGVDVRI